NACEAVWPPNDKDNRVRAMAARETDQAGCARSAARVCSEPMQAPVRPPAIKIIALRDGPDILLFGVLYVVFHYSHRNSAQADVLEFANLWASSKLALASSPESRMALFRIEIESPRAEGPSLLRWHQMSNRAQYSPQSASAVDDRIRHQSK